MNFPQTLSITAFDIGSRQGVARMALKLILAAPRKNNYTIPMVTNSIGEVHLSIEHVRQSIKDDWALFPMDYISPLEDCSADVEIRVCTSDDVERTVKAMKMFGSASTISDELIHGFEHCVNSRYFPTVQYFDVEESRQIKIGVSPCPQVAS